MKYDTKNNLILGKDCPVTFVSSWNGLEKHVTIHRYVPSSNYMKQKDMLTKLGHDSQGQSDYCLYLYLYTRILTEQKTQ